MNIEIRKLTPKLVNDYTCFFDTTPHNDTNKGDKCYCVTFCNDKVYHSGGEHWYSTPEERRTHGMKRVLDGDIQGYLAYNENSVIGWCNANEKINCQLVISNMQARAGVPVEDCKADEKIKSVFCFAIAPTVQKMGVATRLLEHICNEATTEGFDFVEAYTHRDFIQDGFRGTLTLYENCGFVIHAEKGGKLVMRKALKQ